MNFIAKLINVFAKLVVFSKLGNFC